MCAQELQILHYLLRNPLKYKIILCMSPGLRIYIFLSSQFLSDMSEKLHAYGGGTAQDFNLFPSSLLIKRTHIIQLKIMILKNKLNVNSLTALVNLYKPWILLHQQHKNRHNHRIIPIYKLIFSCHCKAASVYSAYIDHGHESLLVYIEDRCPYTVYALVTYNTDYNV